MKPLILVFARVPQPGKVKTRLVPLLGEQGACELYQQLLRHTLQTVRRQTAFDHRLVVTPATEPFQELAPDFDVQLQCDGDLGERMAHAAGEGLASASKVILVGTDCPGLCSEDFHQANLALDEGADVVLGPAADGGYYLLGLKSVPAALFAGIAWGTDQVLLQTRTACIHNNLSTVLLTEREDIDRPEDLLVWNQA